MMKCIQFVISLIAIAGPLVVADGIIIKSVRGKIQDNRNDLPALEVFAVKKLASTRHLKAMVSSMSKAPSLSANTAETKPHGKVQDNRNDLLALELLAVKKLNSARHLKDMVSSMSKAPSLSANTAETKPHGKVQDNRNDLLALELLAVKKLNSARHLKDMVSSMRTAPNLSANTAETEPRGKVQDNRNDLLALELLAVKKLNSARHLKDMASSMGTAPNLSTNMAETAAILKKMNARVLKSDDTSRPQVLMPTRLSLSSLALQDYETSAGMSNRKLQSCDLDSLATDFLLCSSVSCSSCLIDSLEAIPIPFTCNSFADDICLAIETGCDCGDCRDEAEDFFRCGLDEVFGEDCPALNCPLPTKPPTRGPTMSPTVESVAAATCDSPLDEFFFCASLSCSSCIVDAFTAIVEGDLSCDGFADDICLAIVTDCDCGDCRDEAEDFFRCVVDEIFGEDCPALNCPLPTKPPTRGPTMSLTVEPVAASTCDSPLDEFFFCASLSCSSCIVDAFTAIVEGALSCDGFSDDICLAIVTDCDCSDCRDEAEDLFRCVVDEIFGEDCPALNCQTPDPPPTCDSVGMVFRSCASSSCASCLGDALDAIPSFSCNSFTDDICLAIVTDCDCGDCRDEAEDLFGCTLDDASGGECPTLKCQTPVPAFTPSESLRESSLDSAAAVYLSRWSSIVVVIATILLAAI